MLHWYRDGSAVRRPRDVPATLLRVVRACGVLVAVVSSNPSVAAEAKGAARFRKQVEPVLSQFCFDCHAAGANKGGVAFDPQEAARERVLCFTGVGFRSPLRSRSGHLRLPARLPLPTRATSSLANP